jgi:hypothetical protein
MGLKLGTWAGVDGDCAIDYTVCESGAIELHFGGADGFDFDLDARAARNLGNVMVQALAEQALIRGR